MKRLREIAKEKGVVMTIRQGGSHEVVLFDEQRVTTVPRHTEINEYTARGAITVASDWMKEG